jgi:hypothetical protein
MKVLVSGEVHVDYGQVFVESESGECDLHDAFTGQEGVGLWPVPGASQLVLTGVKARLAERSLRCRESAAALGVVLRGGADHLDLDRAVPGQRRHTYGGPRMLAVLPQNLGQERACCIRYHGLVTEVGGAGNEDQHLHKPDAFQATDR